MEKADAEKQVSAVEEWRGETNMRVYCENQHCLYNKTRYPLHKGGPQTNQRCTKNRGTLHLDEDGKCLDFKEKQQL